MGCSTSSSADTNENKPPQDMGRKGGFGERPNEEFGSGRDGGAQGGGPHGTHGSHGGPSGGQPHGGQSGGQPHGGMRGGK